MITTDSPVPAKKAKGVQVHATIDQELHQKLEDHRWTVRLNMVDVVKLALVQYAEREGLVPTTGAAGDDADDATGDLH